MNRRTIAISALLAALLSGVALFFALNLANPTDSGPAGILLVLFLVYVLSLGIVLLAAVVGQYAFRLIVPMRVDATLRDRLRRTMHRMVVVSVILSFVPIFIISLSSIGQLGFTDFILIVATEVVAIFYALKRM